MIEAIGIFALLVVGSATCALLVLKITPNEKPKPSRARGKKREKTSTWAAGVCRLLEDAEDATPKGGGGRS